MLNKTVYFIDGKTQIKKEKQQYIDESNLATIQQPELLYTYTLDCHYSAFTVAELGEIINRNSKFVSFKKIIFNSLIDETFDCWVCHDERWGTPTEILTLSLLGKPKQMLEQKCLYIY